LSVFGNCNKRDGEGDKQAGTAVQKNFGKSEKKACHRFRDWIIRAKPNQTNGETNDKKCAE
jgi:hypothetical protein